MGQFFAIKCVTLSLFIPTKSLTFGGCAPFAVAPKNHRVVTEKTVFSMPESTIGYFNDAGASYFLSRLKNNVGFYMSLASARIYGGDIKKIGLADYFVLNERLEELEKSLAECKNQQEIEKTLSKFASEPKESKLEGILPLIDKCFDGDNVEEIIDNLHLDGSEWAMDTIKVLNKLSPTSLKVCHREHTLGKKMSLRDCLKMEFRMACHHAAGSDLHEGVRALLIDKDNKPNYKPSTLHDVEEEHIERFMKPLPNGDELSFEER
jgi:3-hydroxyisobutyryl-CoA hydrolase